MKCKVYCARQLKEVVGDGDGGIFLWQRLTESRKIINFSYIDVCNNSSGERLGKKWSRYYKEVEMKNSNRRTNTTHLTSWKYIFLAGNGPQHTILIICDWSSAITNWSSHISHAAHSSGSTKLFEMPTRCYSLYVCASKSINSKRMTKFK